MSAWNYLSTVTVLTRHLDAQEQVSERFAPLLTFTAETKSKVFLIQRSSCVWAQPRLCNDGPLRPLRTQLSQLWVAQGPSRPQRSWLRVSRVPPDTVGHWAATVPASRVSIQHMHAPLYPACL